MGITYIMDNVSHQQNRSLRPPFYIPSYPPTRSNGLNLTKIVNTLMLENRPERRNTGAILLQLTTSYKVEGANMLHPSDELWHPDIVMTPLRPFARLRALRTRERHPQVLCIRLVHGVKSGCSAKKYESKKYEKNHRFMRMRTRT